MNEFHDWSTAHMGKLFIWSAADKIKLRAILLTVVFLIVATFVFPQGTTLGFLFLFSTAISLLALLPFKDADNAQVVWGVSWRLIVISVILFGFSLPVGSTLKGIVSLVLQLPDNNVGVMVVGIPFTLFIVSSVFALVSKIVLMVQKL